MKTPGQKVSAGFCPIVYLMLPHMVLFPFPFILIKGPCFDIFNTSSSVAPSPLLSFLLVLSHCAYYYHTIISHIISYSFDKRLTHRVGVPWWVPVFGLRPG